MNRNPDITQDVHRRGGRMTPQRRVVLETLAGVDCHPTAVELYEMVREKLPGISPGTVYRNLKVLKDLGYVLELDYGPGAAHYDATVADHCHARCERCGRVVDVPGATAQTHVAAGPDAPEGWRITGHRLELCGLCPDCIPEKVETKPEEEDRP